MQISHFGVVQETGNWECFAGCFKMASKSNDSSDNVEKILLEEQDMPGAELPTPAEE